MLNSTHESGTITYTCEGSRWKGSSPCKDLTCGVGCQSKEKHGTDYDGKGNTTVTGRTCQKWSTKEPWSHTLGRFGDHNYCRNPGNPSGVWCYTTDTDLDHRWEFCPIPLCGTNPSCPPYASQLSPGLSCSSPGLECPLRRSAAVGSVVSSPTPAPPPQKAAGGNPVPRVRTQPVRSDVRMRKLLVETIKGRKMQP